MDCPGSNGVPILPAIVTNSRSAGILPNVTKISELLEEVVDLVDINVQILHLN